MYSAVKNMPWCKKNKNQLQKPEKKKISLSNDKYTKTETSNTKTVTPSSSWFLHVHPQVYYVKTKFHRKFTRTENLNKYFDLLKKELSCN